MKTQQSKLLGCSKGSPKRKIHCNPGLSQETRKIPNTKFNSTPKGTRSRTTKKPHGQQKKRNNEEQSRNKQYRVQAKNKKQYSRSKKLRVGFLKK